MAAEALPSLRRAAAVPPAAGGRAVAADPSAAVRGRPSLPAAAPSTFLLLRALEQTEAGLKEITDQLQQQEAVSSLLLGLASPCALPGSRSSASLPVTSRLRSAAVAGAAVGAADADTSGAAEAAAGDTAGAELTSAGGDTTAAVRPIEGPTRIFFPLTSQALMPGTLLPAALPPLLHIGSDFFAACKPGELRCSQKEKLFLSADSREGPSAASQTSPAAAASSGAATAAGTATAAADAAAAAAGSHASGSGAAAGGGEGCGALGVLGRRFRLLQEQLDVLQQRRRQLKEQLALLQHLREEETDIQQLQYKAAADRSRQQATNVRQEGSGRTRRTADGFVEIVEEYVSDDEGDEGGEQQPEGNEQQQDQQQEQALRQHQQQERQRAHTGQQQRQPQQRLQETQEKQQQQQAARASQPKGDYGQREQRQHEPPIKAPAASSSSREGVEQQKVRMEEKNDITGHEKRTEEFVTAGDGRSEAVAAEAAATRGVCGGLTLRRGSVASEKRTSSTRGIDEESSGPRFTEKSSIAGSSTPQARSVGDTRDSGSSSPGSRSNPTASAEDRKPATKDKFVPFVETVSKEDGKHLPGEGGGPPVRDVVERGASTSAATASLLSGCRDGKPQPQKQRTGLAAAEGQQQQRQQQWQQPVVVGDVEERQQGGEELRPFDQLQQTRGEFGGKQQQQQQKAHAAEFRRADDRDQGGGGTCMTRDAGAAALKKPSLFKQLRQQEQRERQQQQQREQQQRQQQ